MQCFFNKKKLLKNDLTSIHDVKKSTINNKGSIIKILFDIINEFSRFEFSRVINNLQKSFDQLNINVIKNYRFSR